MTDPRVSALADVLVRYSLAVTPGDSVLLRGDLLAAPLVRELYRAALEAGGHPEVRLVIDELEAELIANGSEAQLAWLDPGALADVERCDCRTYVLAPANTRALAGADPARQATLERTSQPLLETLVARQARRELRSVVTAFPTEGLAQEAGMSLAGYSRFLFGACLVDEPDPVAAWQRLGDRLERTCERLAGVRELRVRAPGTDLLVPVEGRTWVAAGGRENMPDGEVFTAPHAAGVEGEIAISFPSLFSGRVVDGARLVFRGGRAVEVTATRGEELLRSMVGLDEGAARLGEFAFGLNDGITRATGEALLDEKIGGTVHVALGAAYPECGGTNESALHWDLVCDLRDGGEVLADGELVYRDGRFLPGFLEPV